MSSVKENLGVINTAVPKAIAGTPDKDYSPVTAEHAFSIKKAKIDALFHEYETIRQESLDSIKNRSQILSFGLASIAGLLTVGGVVIDKLPDYEFPLVAIFYFGIPVISTLCLLIWLGEVHRMMRAGFHVKEIENRINKLLGDNILTWENNLRNRIKSEKRQMKYPYVAVIALFIGFVAVSPIIGLLITYKSLFSKFYILPDWKLVLAIFPWICCLLICIYIVKQQMNFR
ncbi:MAG: hypothetical protein ACM3S2_10195 [Ignavibacteriales bacterium]